MCDATRNDRCYLLAGRGGKYYVGVGWPHGRLRRHNGELSGGAARTERGRPWAIVLEIYGFGSRNDALSLEWSLHHPAECFQLRDVNREHTLHGQLRMLLILLKSARWRGMGLGVHFVRDEWGGRAASKAAARRYDALEATLLGTGELGHVPVSFGSHESPRDVSAPYKDVLPPL